MLGLEALGQAAASRSGTELRSHQVDALAGMLTALITANQREPEEANGFEALHEADDENGDLNGLVEENGQVEEVEDEPAAIGDDPGAVRRYIASASNRLGKTIAAAGFVEAARTAGVSSSPTAGCSSVSSSAS